MVSQKNRKNDIIMENKIQKKPKDSFRLISHVLKVCRNMSVSFESTPILLFTLSLDTHFFYFIHRGEHLHGNIRENVRIFS